MVERIETNESIIQRLQAASDMTEAAQIMGELWRRNLPLVNKIVRKMTGLNESADGFEDMQQQAFFGFRAAAYSFNSATGVQFSTYAYNQIRWELSRYYERNGYIIHIPAYIKKRLRDCTKRKKQLEAVTGQAVTYAAALADMGFSPAAVTGTLAAFKKIETVSLDSTYTGNEDGATLLELIASGEDVAEAAILQEWHKELHGVLMSALQEVSEDTKEIILRRFFVGVSYKQQATAQGITKQTIHKRVNAAFATIRAGKYGAVLASFLTTSNECERAKRLIRQDKEAIKRLQLTEPERGLLIL